MHSGSAGNDSHGHSHQSSHGDGEDSEFEAVFKGLAALGGIFFFFVAEKLVAGCADSGKKQPVSKSVTLLKIANRPSIFKKRIHTKVEPLLCIIYIF